MIKSFKHKGLKKFFEQGIPTGIIPEHVEKIRLILGYIDRTKNVDDLNLPGFKLHKLKGNRQDIWSITVRANWRITFMFENSDAYILDYEDYH
jgi:proteic killer suppression protein